MFIVKFVQSYNSIPSGFSFEFDGTSSVKLNGVTFTLDNLFDLEDMGIVGLTDSSAPTDVGCVGCGTTWVTCYLVWEEREKVTTAVGDDLNNGKFVFGNDYKFYDIENKTWKVSRLKKTASHLGRVAWGFAVPVDASAKKMFNRLEKLNVMYDLGLSREVCREITNYN